MLRDAFVTSLQFQDPVDFAGYLSGWDGGWSMSTRDMARIGYWLLRDGNWHGTQLLPASFVNALYSVQIPSGATWNDVASTGQFYNEIQLGEMPKAYSFGFWVSHARSQSDPERSDTEAITMIGAFGTTVFISRSTDLVIAAVNTSGRHQGGRILGVSLDALAEAVEEAAPPAFWGRIAISADGNEHNCDDITATAMTIALLATTGNAHRLVYYGYSDHLRSTGRDSTCNGGNREEEMRIFAVETATCWGGFNTGVFYNAKQHTTAAVNALAAQINQSSASQPLWIIAAGSMEVVGRALAASDASRRPFVTVVSHSTWNDFHAEEPDHGQWNFDELESILGAHTYHLIDQNDGLKASPTDYLWLRDAADPKLRWLWDRHIVSGLAHFDPSDAGMVYWLLHGGPHGGDQHATPHKLKTILTRAPSATPCSTVD